MDNVVYEDGQTCAPCGDVINPLGVAPDGMTRVIDQQVVVDERIREPIRRYDDAVVEEERITLGSVARSA